MLLYFETISRKDAIEIEPQFEKDLLFQQIYHNLRMADEFKKRNLKKKSVKNDGMTSRNEIKERNGENRRKRMTLKSEKKKRTFRSKSLPTKLKKRKKYLFKKFDFKQIN